MRALSVIAAICAAAVLASCGGTSADTSGQSIDPELDSMRSIWAGLYLDAEHDSLVRITYPFLEKSLARGDSMAVLLSCANAAQSFLFMDRTDSARRYMDMAGRYVAACKEPRLMAMLNNLEGIYAVKFELNYPKALECFHQMCSIAGEEGETEPYILALTNIVSVFYLMNDRHGIDYALKALEVYPSLPDNGDVNYLYKAQIFLSLARMYYLEGDAPRAMSYLSGADSLVNEYDFRPIIPSVSLLYADLYYMTGDAPRADSCFRKALSGAKEEDSGMITTVCLDYGRFMEASGRDGDAIALYEEGLQYSQSHDNLIFRSELLKRLADLCARTGNERSSLAYSSEYHRYEDSLEIRKREQEFSALRLSYQNMEYRNAMQAKDLELANARHRSSVFRAVAGIVLLLAVFLLVLYRNQKKMYKLLVSRHQEAMKRFRGSEALSRNDRKEDTEKEIYLQVEALMRDRKLYRNKDMGLDRLAELLDTNRTYVSKAVNKYSGMSFSSYLNMYRINEATAVISDPSRNVLLKQLADDLGYNSVTVFSKAFQKETGLTPSRYRKEIMDGGKKEDDL